MLSPKMKIGGLALVSFLGSAVTFAETAPSFPPLPRLQRDLTHIRSSASALDSNGKWETQLTIPHIPPHRTTQDGRIAVNVVTGTQLYLFRPEAVTAPILNSPPGVLMTVVSKVIPWLSLHNSSLKNPSPADMMGTICDMGSLGTKASPYAATSCGGQTAPAGQMFDCYDITIMMAVSGRLGSTTGPYTLELWSTPVQIAVSNPKQANANIQGYSLGTPVGPYRPSGDTSSAWSFYEPMFVDNGKLLINRFGFHGITWPAGSSTILNTNIAYTRLTRACDVTSITGFAPITHAPFDPQMNQTYGFAAYPMKDSEGVPLQDNVNFPGSYPWMDRAGANLFFSAVTSSLYGCPTTLASRFVISSPQGEEFSQPTSCSTVDDTVNNESSYDFENANDLAKGLSVVGLWTHGKMVHLDSTVNFLDFGLRTDPRRQRRVELYAGGGSTLLGSGRDHNPLTFKFSADLSLPAGIQLNANIPESLQNINFLNPNFRPLTVKDVVWTMSTGIATDEIPFDDYLSVNELIYSPMDASISQGNPSNPTAIYKDGWPLNARPFVFTAADLHVQNAATSPRFAALPTYGKPLGNIRIEPVAQGGINGRGMYLDGVSGLEYDISGVDLANFATAPWYVSMFVDTEGSSSSYQRLWTFPNQSAVEMVSGVYPGSIRYLDPTGAVLRVIPLPLPLLARGWHHIGLQLNAGSTRAPQLYVDGYLYDVFPGASFSLPFGMLPGKVAYSSTAPFYVGAPPNTSAGFIGWIDEFKVLQSAEDPENACNHANGSLLALSGASSGLSLQASYYKTHTVLSAYLGSRNPPGVFQYVCWHDYSRDHGIDLKQPPPQTLVLRSLIHFPEGPLNALKYRPNSTGNHFCLGCHSDSNARASLSVGKALAAGTVPMELDPRRQPFQPPVKIHGVIPMDYFGYNTPSSAIDADAPGNVNYSFVDQFYDYTKP